ncbi:hypothetical protein ABNB56_07235 [Streptococcus iniae]|uniref:hypothetical protein n=1 Tax=Streptococcus iniae TaxID=1346 RepID=UPI000EFB9BAA|nr:hypothetical protein [Streptococcus iniae]RMI79781.1 hypothetical protein DIX58_00870 [Streptococcus iniae]
MPLYKAEKNLLISSINKEIPAGEMIELDESLANAVNEDLKLTCPDVESVLTLIDETPKAKKQKEKTVEKAAE